MKRHKQSLVAASTLTLLVLAGCSGGEQLQPAPTVTVTAQEAAPADVQGDMMGRVPTAAWECGQISALLGIQERSEWQHDNDVIDDAEHAARLTSLQDAWAVFRTGDSDVSALIPAVSEASKDGVTRSNAAFFEALDATIDACDAAGSVISVDMLPEMGG